MPAPRRPGGPNSGRCHSSTPPIVNASRVSMGETFPPDLVTLKDKRVAQTHILFADSGCKHVDGQGGLWRVYSSLQRRLEGLCALYTNPDFGHLRVPDTVEVVAVGVAEVSGCQTSTHLMSTLHLPPATWPGLVQAGSAKHCDML